MCKNGKVGGCSNSNCHWIWQMHVYECKDAYRKLNFDFVIICPGISFSDLYVVIITLSILQRERDAYTSLLTVQSFSSPVFVRPFILRHWPCVTISGLTVLSSARADGVSVTENKWVEQTHTDTHHVLHISHVCLLCILTIGKLGK